MAIIRENIDSIVKTFDKTMKRLDTCIAQQEEAAANARARIDVAMADEKEALSTAERAARIRGNIAKLVA